MKGRPWMLSTRLFNVFVLCLATAAIIIAPTLHAQEETEATEPNTDVLLIAPDDLAEAWAPLADWKTRLGKRTKILTITQIEEEYQGDDIQQKIRNCCLEHIDLHGTKWIILGGDSRPDGSGGVPDRDTKHANSFVQHADIPTDVYYVSELDWDANDDGVYGEWGVDADAIAYTNPQATIGRIPVRTVEDVAAYTAKVIGYESRYPTDEFAWQFVYTCPERGAYPKLRTSRNLLADAWQQGSLFDFFAHRTPWDVDSPGDFALSPEHWIELINGKTVGKIHMHGHGFLPLWALESPQGAVTATHVEKLTNEDAYLAITTVSCFTGQFDGEEDPCITESMLRHPLGGAVLIIAPARAGVPAFHDPARDFPLMMSEGKMDGTTETMTLFWKYALTENMTAGEAFRAAKIELTDDAEKTSIYHFVQCELNLLGDPTLDIRAKTPATPLLEIPESIEVGPQTLSINTGQSATVCLWKGDEVYQVVETYKGFATVEIEPLTGGRIFATVSGPNLNAVTGEILVQ
jgi:hypothetical protein